MRPRSALIPLAAVVLAGCAGASQPLTARELAAKIPGCHPASSGSSVSVYAVAEVWCVIPGGEVQLATFRTAGDQMSWIRAQGRYNGSCCVKGGRWAALVSGGSPAGQYAAMKQVAKAAGGRVITYP